MNNTIKLEENLLYLCLTDIKILSENISRINEDFFSEDYKWIWIYLKKCFTNYGTLLNENIIEDFAREENRSEKDIEKFKTIYTFLLTCSITPDYIHYLIEELNRVSLFKKVITITNDSLNRFKEGKHSTAVDVLFSGLLSLFSNSDLYLSRGEYIESFNERKKELEEKIENSEKSYGVLTGISKLDEITRGLFPGELGLVMGKTSIGKSMLVLHFARNAFWNGKKVLYIVEEMPLRQVFMRIDAAFSGIEYFKFKSGTILPFEKEKWEMRIKELENLYQVGSRLYVVHMPVGCTVEAIKREIEYIRICKKETIDLLIVDDLDMMEYPKQLSEEQGQARNARGLKGIAGEYNIPVWFTTQITTKAYKKEMLDSEDVGWSRRKIHVADFVIGLVQTEVSDINEEIDRTSDLNKILSLQIIKFRDGEINKTIQLSPDLSKCLINVETAIVEE